MAIHLIPLLLAKVAGKLALKKAAVHGGHRSLAGNLLKEGGKQAAKSAVQGVAGHRDKKDSKDKDG
ncbi:MAG: hypothetical protein WBX25_15565 [Rhodomicrobium sp.]